MSTDPRMGYFMMLSEPERRAAIQRLARSGMSDHTIAAATQLSVEMVRSILAEHGPPPPACPSCDE